MDNYLYNSKIWIKYLEEHFDECRDYFKFAMVWMSFNSFYQLKYRNIDGDKNKVINFCSDNKNIYDNLLKSNDEFKKIFVDFSNTKYLNGENDRKCVANETNNQKWYFDENDKNSCNDFFNVIYQIRCNLFHGSKDITIKHNYKLIQWAYKYLSIFWENFLTNN